MKTKLLILAFAILCTISIHGKGKAPKRAGIQNGGDFRIIFIYPFAQTLSKNDRNLQLNKDNEYDGFRNSGIFTSGKIYLNEKYKLMFRYGLGAEYCFHKRVSFDANFKHWKFKQEWDTNHITQVGYYTHMSFPINLRYEYFRREFMSLRAGIGIEPYIKTDENFARVHYKQSTFFIFFTSSYPDQVKATNGKDIDSDMTFELSAGFKVHKRLNIDVFVRFVGRDESNYTNINLSYKIGEYPVKLRRIFTKKAPDFKP